MRAVDLLQSLEFVDSKRIGAVGLSMGASDVYHLMVVDERVKAGISSSDGMNGRAADFLALISPRLYIGIKGTFDGPPDNLPNTQEMHANARPYYEADGLFGDKVKWMAYKHLKEHFDVLPPKTRVDLSEIVMRAREASRWMPEEEQGGTFPEPSLQEDFLSWSPKKKS